jgi:hypothetical protein
MINDICKENASAGTALMNKYCRSPENQLNCPAYAFNERTYEPVKNFKEEAREVEDPFLRTILHLLSDAANIAFQEWKREEAKKSGIYQALKSEMYKAVEK